MQREGTRLHADIPIGKDADRSANVMRRDPTIGFFWSLVLIHVALWTILPTVTQPNVPEETLQLLAAGDHPAWGYHENSPLPVWLASALCAFTAPSVWPAYLLAQLTTLVCLWAAWRMAREFLHPWTALCAALILEGCFFFSIGSAALTQGHLVRCFWALSILAFYWALTRERRRYWVALGVCLGLGILSGYSTLLLLGTMIIFSLWDERARRCWDSSWPFLAALVMAAVILPHGLWLWRSEFASLIQTFTPSAVALDHVASPGMFLLMQLLAIIPALLLLAPLITHVDFHEESDGNDDQDFIKRYLLWLTLLPPAVMFTLLIVSGIEMTAATGTALWTFAGVLMLVWSRRSETRLAWRQVILRCGTVGGVFAALLIAMNVMLPVIRKQPGSVHFPGKSVAEHVQRAWREWGYEQTPRIIGGPSRLARNASWYSPGRIRPAVFEDLDSSRSFGLKDDDLGRLGGMLIWDAESEDAYMPEELIDRFGNVTLLEPVELNWQTRAAVGPLRLGMAIIHPRVEPLASAEAPFDLR